MKLLEGRVAIVTGGSRGIGEAIVMKFAQHGASVAFSYVSSDQRAEALAEKVRGLGVSCKAYKGDAGNFAACGEFVAEVIKDFGKIDICVNNAGISRDNLLLRMTPEQWDEVMTTNLKSVYNMTKQVIMAMIKAKKGSIINMSSIIGVKGNAGQSSYAASKA
ncbi:MAG: SDR family NAD(P)-dependent oxidoreductase, partial [Bacteroidota bacterium]|nr:SDR family NAD(P)-dependent oxidoreductase [Bacteroidota bacterium]